uniref:Uncharacterized protein n=1 Tax=Arundo donax TaxID=35708 RepID=A0A0A8Y7P9_ARUDO
MFLNGRLRQTIHCFDHLCCIMIIFFSKFV